MAAPSNDTSTDDADKTTGVCFRIPLPGGRVARIPQEVLEQYIEADAKVTHDPSPAKPGGSKSTTTIQAGESMITINIYAGQGEIAVNQHDAPSVSHKQGESEDVTAHSLSVDASTGMSEWHTDWENGECEYTDETGFPQRITAWHRHPFGTEYSEIWEG